MIEKKAKMLNTIEPLARIFKIKRICESDFVFILNTKITVAILLLSSILISVKDWFGVSIDCFTDNAKLKTILDNFCWTNGTFISATSISGKSYF